MSEVKVQVRSRAGSQSASGCTEKLWQSPLPSGFSPPLHPVAFTSTDP